MCFLTSLFTLDYIIYIDYNPKQIGPKANKIYRFTVLAHTLLKSADFIFHQTLTGPYVQHTAKDRIQHKVYPVSGSMYTRSFLCIRNQHKRSSYHHHINRLPWKNSKNLPLFHSSRKHALGAYLLPFNSACTGGICPVIYDNETSS